MTSRPPPVAELLHVTGQVSLGDEASLRAIADAMAAAGTPVEQSRPVLPHGAFRASRPSGAVLVEPHSGVLAAGECLRAFRQAAAFELRTGCRVTRCARHPDSVFVTMPGSDDLRADIVVDCAGAAALGLLDVAAPAGGAPSLPQVAYFAPRTTTTEPPIFIEWGDAMVYGLPVPGGAPRRHLQGLPSHARLGLGPFDPADPTPFAGDDPELCRC